MRPWIQDVVDFCEKNGGRITSEEIEHIVPSRIVHQRGLKYIQLMRRDPHVKVEVVERKRVQRGWAESWQCVYRITLR